MHNILRTHNKGLGGISVSDIRRTDKPQSIEIQRKLHTGTGTMGIGPVP